MPVTKISERLRAKLERELPALLGTPDVVCVIDDLWINRSASRCKYTSYQVGTWGGSGRMMIHGSDKPGTVFKFDSYDTMTECVKQPIVASWRGSAWCSGIDITAKET